MADGPGGRQGQPGAGHQADFHGRRPERARLSLQSPDAERGGRDTGVQAGRGDGAPPSVRDDAVRGTRRRGRPPKDAGNGGGLRAGDDGQRDDSAGGATFGLQTLRDHPRPQFPDVEDRYRGPPETGVAVVGEARLREGDVLSADTSKFDRITDKALDVLETCLDEHRGDADHLRLMNLKLAAAQSILNSRIKVDDTILRRRQLDIMPKIIQMMREEKERLLALGETL